MLGLSALIILFIVYSYWLYIVIRKPYTFTHTDINTKSSNNYAVYDDYIVPNYPYTWTTSKFTSYKKGIQFRRSDVPKYIRKRKLYAQDNKYTNNR